MQAQRIVPPTPGSLAQQLIQAVADVAGDDIGHLSWEERLTTTHIDLVAIRVFRVLARARSSASE
jgi:hypothetical protein